MREKFEQRLNELKAELETGQSQGQSDLKQQVLRA